VVVTRNVFAAACELSEKGGPNDFSASSYAVLSSVKRASQSGKVQLEVFTLGNLRHRLLTSAVLLQLP
jgi:hypothetical protein